jgi:hypothetical protein
MKLIKVKCKDGQFTSHTPGEKPVDEAKYGDWHIDFYIGKNNRWNYHAYAANRNEIERVDFRTKEQAFSDAKKQIDK